MQGSCKVCVFKASIWHLLHRARDIGGVAHEPLTVTNFTTTLQLIGHVLN